MYGNNALFQTKGANGGNGVGKYTAAAQSNPWFGLGGGASGGGSLNIFVMQSCNVNSSYLNVLGGDSGKGSGNRGSLCANGRSRRRRKC